MGSNVNLLHNNISVSVEHVPFSAVLDDFSAVCRVPGRSSLPQFL